VGGCAVPALAVTTDPLLADAPSGDVTPLSGSPLIDAGDRTGVDKTGAVAGDFFGAEPDIGAVEVP
jgi:hypothetical protein